MSAPGKVSKNQRAGGPRQAQRKHVCAAGHEQVNVLLVGHGMRWMCECDGYTPIDVRAPYRQIHAKVKVGGKGRDWFEQPRGEEA